MSNYINRIVILFFLIALGGGSVFCWRLIKDIESEKELYIASRKALENKEKDFLDLRKELDLFYNKSATRRLTFNRSIRQAALLHIARSVDGKYPSGEGLLNGYYSPDNHLGYMEKSLDTWGIPYRCETIPVLMSSGLDGIFDTKDDIFVRVESQVVSNLLFKMKRINPDIEYEFREARKVQE